MPKGIPNARSVYLVSESEMRGLVGSLQSFINNAQVIPLGGTEAKVQAKPKGRPGRKPKVQTQETPTIKVPSVE